jgi:hypothetical protein
VGQERLPRGSNLRAGRWRVSQARNSLSKDAMSYGVL